METPSLAMIPSAYADSKVYSVLPNNGDGDFTFNRDSSATRVGQNGLIQEVGYFSSELVTNGDYTNGLTGWSTQIPSGQSVTVTSNQLRINYDSLGTQGSTGVNQTILTAGVKVKIVIDIASITGTLRIQAGGQVEDISTTGIHTFEKTPTSTILYIIRKSNALSLDVTINSISVQAILGDQPRLNYDILNGAVQSCPSLLLEPASTNLFPNSEDYTVFNSVSAGTGTNPVITSNYSVSPDGTQNADRIQFNRGSGTTSSDASYITKSLSLGTIDATLSIYLKTNDGTTKDVTLRLGGGLFDYDVIVTSDWQRFTLSGNTSVDRVQILLYGNKNSQTADLSCFGTQIEALSYPTSYIPTNGSSQTRAAETCDDAGTASTFNSTEGVLYAEISALANSGNFRQLTISDSSTSDRVSIDFTSTDNQIRSFSSSGGSTVANMTGSVSNATEFNKVAVKYKLNDYALWINGVEVATDSSAAAPVGLSELAFDNGTGGNPFQGNVKDIRVYNEALTDAQLQTLTS